MTRNKPAGATFARRRVSPIFKSLESRLLAWVKPGFFLCALWEKNFNHQDTKGTKRLIELHNPLAQSSRLKKELRSSEFRRGRSDAWWSWCLGGSTHL